MESDGVLRGMIVSKNEVPTVCNKSSVDCIKCLKCSATFNSADELQLHLKTHERRRLHKKSIPQNETLICKVCNKVYLKASNLAAHMGTHNGFKPFECKICFKCFTQGIPKK